MPETAEATVAPAADAGEALLDAEAEAARPAYVEDGASSEGEGAGESSEGEGEEGVAAGDGDAAPALFHRPRSAAADARRCCPERVSAGAARAWREI